MSVSLVADTVGLMFAAVNIILLLSILSRITSIAESPRAWNFLTVGLGFVIIKFAVDVFVLVNPYFDFLAMHALSAAASLAGFGFLFAGIHRIWGVMYA